MILADTSVWIDHFKRRNETLCDHLEDGEIAVHPYVIGELACGHLRSRAKILQLFAELPSLAGLELREALAFVEAHKLMGLGLGWADVHLLAAARLGDAQLWTLDKRLETTARRLGVGKR